MPLLRAITAEPLRIGVGHARRGGGYSGTCIAARTILYCRAAKAFVSNDFVVTRKLVAVNTGKHQRF